MTFQIYLAMGEKMPKAFVLITSELGKENEVLANLKKIKGVKEVYTLYGVYDVIAHVECDGEGDLRNLVTNRIRNVGNVRATMTLMVAE